MDRKQNFSRIAKSLALFILGTYSLNAMKLSGWTLPEVKVGWQAVNYSYTYTRQPTAKRLADAQYTFIRPIIHERQPGWLSALFMAKGDRVTIVFGGANKQDTEDFSKRVLGRQPTWSYIGKIHQGFLDHHEGLWPQIQKALKKYLTQIDRPVSQLSFDFVGHSMGAALAHIAAIRVKLVYSAGNNASHPIRVLTFGGVRMLHQTMAMYYTSKVGLNTRQL